MIEYKDTKEFDQAQLAALFQSVGWFSGGFPARLQQALRNSGAVRSVWDGARLVGLIRGLDDGVWQATIDCRLVDAEDQGRGIASALLQQIMHLYREYLYINVAPDEEKNVAFYRRHGFVCVPGSALLQIKGQWA